MQIPIIAGSAVAGIILFFFIRSAAKHKRHAKLKRTPPPESWNAVLQKTFPAVFRLSDEQQQQLFGYMQVFLADINFEGCGGQEITEEIKVTVAAQACMLLIGREHKVYPKLKTILIYPHTYKGGRKGIMGGDNGAGARLGESWNCGVVVLSWNSVVGGARNFEDGQNVTFHEFAHQLDQESGAADGAPILEERSAYSAWARVFSHDFAALCKKTNRGKKDVIDRYGATNPAEFFAVATETFFEKPRQMQKKHPELYEELKYYYKVNPTDWVEH